MGIEPHRAEVDVAGAEIQFVAIGLGARAQQPDVGGVLVEREVRKAGAGLDRERQAVTAGDLGDDFAVGGRCVDAPGAAHVLAVERERGVLALDGDRGGAGLVRIVGKDFADEAAKQLLGVLADAASMTIRFQGARSPRARTVHRPCSSRWVSNTSRAVLVSSREHSAVTSRRNG